MSFISFLFFLFCCVGDGTWVLHILGKYSPVSHTPALKYGSPVFSQEPRSSFLVGQELSLLLLCVCVCALVHAHVHTCVIIFKIGLILCICFTWIPKKSIIPPAHLAFPWRLFPGL
jgi:hypothetical protein